MTKPTDFSPDAYAIRTCAADGGSHGGFRWPLSVGEFVACPDWSPAPQCGGGLHGLLDGIGNWSLLGGDFGRVWQIIAVRRDEVVIIDGNKVKFPRGTIAYSGTAAGAMAFIRPHLVAAIVRIAEGNTATGPNGHAAATGPNAIAASPGIGGPASAAASGLVVLAADAAAALDAGDMDQLALLSGHILHYFRVLRR